MGDRQTGQWLSAAPPSVRRSGRFGATEGPLNLSPEPYGRPLLAQAGSSPEGIAFAARHADQIFTVQSEIVGARRFRAVVRAEAVKAGRDEGEIKVLPGLVPFIGETAAEAEAVLEALTRHVSLDHVLPKLGRFTGLALAGLDLDARLPFRTADLTQNRFSNSRAHLLIEEAQERGYTLRQFAARFAAGRGHLLHVGTGEQLAALMRRWVGEGAADGFNVMPPLLPAGIAPFGEAVMPLLR
jgi:alkanesulfonate monooxygenase SsuD/methylene tetrahydromethanopterin reductase-like flavin-dependent oxidoreductase (luciferase family)